MAILADGYWQQLKHLQNNQSREVTRINTPDYGFFEVDLDQRVVIPPSEYRDFLSLEQEHQAETIYFEAPRYFDEVDLTNTTIIIEYINAENEARIYPAVLQDWTSNPGFIRFAWVLGHEATKTAGTIRFSVRFYSVDQNQKIFTYSLQTQPYQGRIAFGMRDKEGDPVNAFENYDYSSEVITALTQQITESRLRWNNV